MKKFILSVAAAAVCAAAFGQKYEGLANTPPMGWNSWNTFALDINEQLIKDVADAFVTLGLKDAGYEYIVLDDGWMAMERDAEGNLMPHPEKFPNGIKAVSDYVHSKGLKFGLYNCAGTLTCGKYPGSKGHEYQDALKYAEWGADYLKYDWCYTAPIRNMADRESYAKEAYFTMSDALRRAGRPMVFSLCDWGSNNPWKWAIPIGHSWRTTGDIYACFDECPNLPHWALSAMGIVEKHNQDSLRRAAGKGHWNDMDMLEVGNGPFTFYENQSHFALWAMLNSPLMLGNDLRKVSKETLSVLTNKGVIAVSQDTLGIQGFRYKKMDSIEVWVKPLSGGDWALQFLNRGKQAADLVFNWENERINDEFAKRELVCGGGKVMKITDLYAGKELGNTKKPLKAKLETKQSLVVRLSPDSRK